MAAPDQKREEETLKTMNVVKITSKTNVKPSKKIGKKEYQLTTFDLPYLAFHYNQKLIFYKGNDEYGFEKMVEKLKNGLQVVLKEFHPLAGKLGKDDEGVFRVEYDDDMDGVEVAEAVAPENVGIADLTVEEAGGSVLKELIPYNEIVNLEGLHRPLLSVQLTKLKDGLAMGCAFNHAVLDGNSTWHFMSSWAEICNGSHKISVPPFLERTKARDTRVKLDLTLPPDPLASSDGDAKAVSRLRERIFKFSEDAIDKIKSKVNSNILSDGRKSFSTFQSLSEHIWRHVNHARDHLKPESYTVFTVFADCRKRVDPPMPENFFGNLIQAIFTITPVGVLTANHPEFGADLIQKAIEKHDAKAIDERNKEWESSPKIFQFKDAGVNCVAVGSSPRFKVYEVDFGWGKPESVRSGSNNRFDGMVYLYPGKRGGRSVDVEITLEEGTMERLEKDKKFLMEV